MAFNYRADYGYRKSGELVYVAVFRKSTETLLPEEYLNGEWKPTDTAKQAFRDDGEVGEGLLNDPDRITEAEASEIIKGWITKNG